MSELALLCRTCARPAASLQPLFAHPERYKRYALALKLATGLQIEMNDGLPQQICTECSQEINRVLKFRSNSQNAQTRLVALGFRKNNIHDHANYSVSTTVKSELELVEEKNFDSDESLDKSDHYDGSFVKERKIADTDFSDDKIMKCERNLIQMVKPKLLKSITQSDVEKYLDTSARLYTCKECKKQYRSKGSFRQHTHVHTGFGCMCESCGKVFWNMSLLLQHQRIHHGAALDVSTRCPYCEYHPVKIEYLKKHLRTHTGERPYICDACGAGFIDRPLLIQHLTVHRTERNFQCKDCSAKFRGRHELSLHRYRTHRPRRWSYQCARCDKMFSKPFSCRKHMEKLHGIPMDQQEKHIRVPFTL